jgi:hypothetical protein
MRRCFETGLPAVGPARPGGRHCRPCATATTQRWCLRHKDELAERARTRSDEERKIRTARGLRRDLPAPREDRPRTPRGLQILANPGRLGMTRTSRSRCGEHYGDRRDATRKAEAARAELAAERWRVRAELALLPLAVQAELHAATLAGPAGQGCSPARSCIWWTLRRLLLHREA